jgi:type IV secretory pathway TraG/TraD family ATPase VirD4
LRRHHEVALRAQHLHSAEPGVLAISSTKFNPFLRHDPNSPYLFDRTRDIVDAIVTGKNEPQTHFAEGARILLTRLIMWEVIDTPRRERAPSLAHVHDLLKQPVEVASDTDGNECAVAVLRATAGRFVEKSNDLDGVVSPSDTQTCWLMSSRLCGYLVSGTELSRLRREMISCYVVLPTSVLEFFNPWLRLVVSAGLDTVFRQWKRARTPRADYANQIHPARQIRTDNCHIQPHRRATPLNSRRLCFRTSTSTRSAQLHGKAFARHVGRNLSHFALA